MTFFSFFSAFILGLAIINAISPRFSLLEKIGISMLMGLMLETMIIFVLELLGIKIVLNSILAGSWGLSVVVMGVSYKNQIASIKHIIQSEYRIDMNFSYIGILIAIGVLFYFLFAKSLYWPTSEYDSVTGYAGYGKVIAAEGTLDNSIFDYFASSRTVARYIYPPGVAGSFAFTHLSGMEYNKLASTLTYLFFAIAFFALISSETTAYLAALVTLVMLVTPEMFSHASLSLTNMPHSVYYFIAFVSLYKYLKFNDSKYFWVATIFIGLNVWVRSDGAVFVAMLTLLLAFFKRKEILAFNKIEILKVGVFGLAGLVPFVAWQTYVEKVLNASSTGFFVDHLFLDIDKMQQITGGVYDLIFSNTLYGITFFVFFISMAVNYKNLKNDYLYLSFFFASWIGYSFLYYQMDNTYVDSLETLLSASYKRGLFIFVPLAWYYSATNHMTTWAFGQINTLLKVEK